MVRLLVTIALAVVRVVPASAGAVVREVVFTGMVSPNDYASLTVRVSPRSHEGAIVDDAIWREGGRPLPAGALQ
jgi:hypothetical protein